MESATINDIKARLSKDYMDKFTVECNVSFAIGVFQSKADNAKTPKQKKHYKALIALMEEIKKYDSITIEAFKEV